LEIRNLVFDLGNVIVDVDHRRFTDAMGWSYSAFYDFFRSDYFREFETGKSDEEEYFRELSAYIPLKPGDVQRYRDLIGYSFPLRVRTWGIIHYLRLRYRLFLFSNTNSLDYRAVNRAIDLELPFEKSYTSHEQGFLKPDAKAYGRASELFGVRPEESCFFDDREENVRAARSQGWKACRVESEGHLFRLLRELNIVDECALSGF
jgi:putative hydrolase of the HAD superfamily